jgi:V8-like Glu-specific endopeptidase
MIYAEGVPFVFKQPTVTNEQIIFRNNLRQVAILQRAVHLAGAVARILLAPLPNGSIMVGTGFLVDTDILMTNNHVFPSKESARGARVQFNYQRDLANNLLPIDEYFCDPDSLFITDKTLDFTITRIKGKPGSKWGFVGLPEKTNISEGEDIFIIQHPQGGEKMVSMSENMVTSVSGHKIQYQTDTIGGSSGSPAFNDQWELVALHHAAITTKSGKTMNEGIAIGEIKNKIKSYLSSPFFVH